MRSCMYICFLVFGYCSPIFAQEPAVWLEEWLEEQTAEESQGQEEMLEELSDMQLLQEPIDLNRADRLQLVQSGLFSSFEIEALLQHREQFGNLLAWFELQAIPGYTIERIAALSPYCVVVQGHQRGSIAYSFKSAQQRFFLRSSSILQSQQGYKPTRKSAGTSHYLGPRYAMLMRYRSTGKRHSMALNASRDPGELGMDRLGGHLLLRSDGRLQQIVIGDYHIQAGHGLLAQTGFVPGRSAGLAAHYSTGRLLQGATGNQSFGVYRGLATQYKLHERWHGMFWAFRMRWSARIEPTEDDFEVLGISRSGRYRTPTERARRANLPIRGFGTQLQFNYKQGAVQAQFQQVTLDHPLAKQTDGYRLFNPIGHRFLHASVSHRYQHGRWQVYGEMALSQFQHLAILQNVLINLSSNIQTQISYRNYPAAYHNFFANSLRAGSAVNNERGWLWMLALQPQRNIHIDYYLDVYEHPWLRYRVDGPSTGLDQRMQLQYHPDRRSRLSIRMRYSVRERNLPGTHFREPTPYTQWRTTGQWQQQFNESWQLLLRIDKNFFSQAAQQDQAFGLTYRLRWQFGAWRISWQQSHFHAPLFDNRFYISEPDVLYGQGIGMLSGQGTRALLLVQYKYRRGLDFWLRYAHSYFHDREEVGSGLELSAGSLRSDLRFQLQYRF